MDIHYYLDLDGQQFGPYELDQIKSFGLLPNVPVYSTLSKEWAQADSYPELRDSLHEMSEVRDCVDIDVYNATYYLRLDGSDYGPLSLSELTYLDITSDSLLSVDDMNSWKPACEIKDLLQTLNSLTENPDGFMDRIVRQEAEISKLKSELQQHQTRVNEEMEPLYDKPVYDMSFDGVSKYADLEKEIDGLIKTGIYFDDNNENIYRKVFTSTEKEKIYYIQEYSKFIESLKSTIDVIIRKLHGIQSSYENDLVLLDNSAQAVYNNCTKDLKHEEKVLIDTVNQQVDSLRASGNVDFAVDSIKQTLDNRRREINAKYERVRTDELEKVAAKRREVKYAFERLRSTVLSGIRTSYVNGRDYFEKYFNSLYETSKSDVSSWEHLGGKTFMPSSFIMLGSRMHEYSILGEDVVIAENCYVELLNNRNLIIRHNNATKTQAHSIVNSLIGRLLASSSPGKLNVAMIDADEMDGTCDVYKFLNRNIFQILARPEEIRKYLDDKERHIGNIIQNMLLGPIKSLYDYNLVKENKEPYHVIVLEDFPVGVTSESLSLLNKILKNGIRAGVNVILLVNEDKINYSDDTRKAYNNCHIEQLEQNSLVYDLTKIGEKDRLQFDSFTDDQLRKIVQYVNSGVEVRKEEAVLFADYMINKSEWWSRRSARYIEIPFGISGDRQIQKLKITQESGQNSAVVIGIPGSGKSVFLHALICNAAINYSPDELNMYLIDFSGVEFNSYALHNLPHARVIAPEAEREFGMSILNELVEEGARRMELCRNNDVSNIVDLKAKNPTLHIPRLLVIIDEFQKIFEIENDLISREANAKIHTIIQEFRKFGINLILATQKLPSSSILPKDLIANRVVFKSSPADFSSLISWSNNEKAPQLHTGECIYNSESGSSYDNHKVQGFLVTKSDIDDLLDQISSYAASVHYESKFEMSVFRGNEQPDFRNRRLAKAHQVQTEIPESVGVYLGESISIHETDVCAVLRKESAKNILILGGEPHVAHRIVYHAALSATTAHTEHSATFVNMNFMRREDPLNVEMQEIFDSLPFTSEAICKASEVQDSLNVI